MNDRSPDEEKAKELMSSPLIPEAADASVEEASGLLARRA